MSSVPSEVSKYMGNAVKLADIWGSVIYNVKAYGAKGDGVTDDTAAIQSAINAANSGGGGIAFVPPGTYIVSASLKIYSNVTLEGVGSKSIIKASAGLGSNATMLVNNTTSGTVDTYYDTDIVIRNLVFDGNNNATRTNSLVGFVKAQFISLQNVTFQNATSMGIALSGCYFVDFEQCKFTNLGRPKPSVISAPALWVDNHGDGSGNKHITVDTCKFINNNWSGMYFMPQGGKVINNTFLNNGESSIFTNIHGRDITYDNNYIFGALRSNISASGIECGGFNCVMTNNRIYNCQSSGIALTDAQNIIIEKNIIMNNGQDNVYFTGAAGTTIITTQSSPNQPDHIIIKNNRIGDDQTTKTQVYGVDIGNNGSPVTNSVVSDNDLSGNLSGSFHISSAGKWGAGCYTTNNIGHSSVTPKVGEFQAPAATGNFSVTGLGFRPRILEIQAIEVSAARANQCQTKVTGSGANSVGHYSCVKVSATAGSIGSTLGRAVILYDETNTTKLTEATWVSMDEDGFTLNFTTVTVRPYVMYTAYP